jgi:hypothetical protein
MRGGMVAVPIEVCPEGARYHAVWVEPERPGPNYQRINGPVERHIARLADR